MTVLAFTMAEILLSLTIIGVVAAITLPSLTGNINERTWNTQRKALYARMSQSLPLMDALNGYGTFKAASGTQGTSSYNAGADNCAETFVTSGLSKVMKINNICDSEHLADCGIPSEINTLKGNRITTPKTLEALNSRMVGQGSISFNSYSIYKTKAAAFETQNGESVIVYYNPLCTGSLGELPYVQGASSNGGYYVQQRVCANFIYDLNGNKGPNTVGKDIGFMTVMYPFDAQLYMPIPANQPLNGSFSMTAVGGACTASDNEFRTPKADELAAMFVNNVLLDASDYSSTRYLSSEKIKSSLGGVWLNLTQNLVTGVRDDNSNGGIWCVRR